jgi:hypothetical protein
MAKQWGALKLASFGLGGILFGLSACAPGMYNPSYPTNSYPSGYPPSPPSYGSPYGYESDYERRREWERRKEWERQKEWERREWERRRREEERERDKYRPKPYPQPIATPLPPPPPPPPPAVQDRCPPGFEPGNHRCTESERKRGCKDMRGPSGLTCNSRGWAR